MTSIDSIAAAILNRYPEPGEIAFLEHEGGVYFAHYPIHRGDETAPHSAITQLIQGIYELNPDQARRILRQRIYSTHPPTPMCRAMVQVAAKRITAPIALKRETRIASPIAGTLIEVPPIGHSQTTDFFPITPTPLTRSEDPMSLATALAARVPRSPSQRYLCNRAVGAVLVSAEGKILAQSVNQNAKNRTFHAEVTLIQSYWARYRQSFPCGATLYVTLKPCKMCSAMIVRMAKDMRNFKVIYREDDPGPHARHTLLDGTNALAQVR